MTTHPFFATAPKGITSLLLDELRAFGAQDVRESTAGCTFRGDIALAYRVCLWSRLANRVLLRLARFDVASAQDLYEGVRRIDWSAHLRPDDTLVVDFSGRGAGIDHTHFGALKVKDAIVDQFRASHGVRPTIDADRPHLRINVRLERGAANVSVDLSGESLHRRGYRQAQREAPLKENLAAAILLRAGWPAVAEQGGSLVDPMCGAGTLPLEAALMAADVAPGLCRDYFGFLSWQQHDREVWAELLAEAKGRRDAGMDRLPHIVGYDADPRAIDAARANARRAGLKDRLRFEVRDLVHCDVPPTPGLVVANPPYGERLGKFDDLRPLYRELGDLLKERFAGWRAAVFTADQELGKSMRLRARRMHALYNGALECKLLHFDVQSEWFVEERAPAVAIGPGGEMLANRLRKNLKHLNRWAERQNIRCFRLYDVDLPEYAAVIDLYRGARTWVHVQEYEAPKEIEQAKAEARLSEAMAVVTQTLELPREQVFLKVRKRQRGKAQYEKSDAGGSFHEVEEGGLKFLVNFTDYLDTGLFLDHRITRGMLRELARGRDFLNLFAYTGTATVYAAAGNARSTTSVDLSRPYLDWAQRNMGLNGFQGARHRFVQEDCLAWLKEAGQQRGRYGLIFLDPPTFSNSARMSGTFDVQRDHPALLSDAARLLTDDGVLIFSTNRRGFKIDAAVLDRLHIEDITRRTLPEDFARHGKIHQCWRITRKND